MAVVLEADAAGRLLLPLAATPGARYTVEQTGESIIVRPEKSKAEIWWESTTPEQRVAWLRNFVEQIGPGSGLTGKITREDLY